MKKALLTGGAGFIGSNLLSKLLDEDWDVDCVDDLSTGRYELVSDHVDLDRNFSFFKIDFSHSEVLDLVKQRNYDTIFHLAAIPRVSFSIDHPIKTTKVNVMKSLKLLKMCAGHTRRVVFASSSSVYGGADILPTPEHHLKNPKSPYALQKSVVEDFAAQFSKFYGLDVVCLRFFNVFGPNQYVDNAYATAIANWCYSINENLPLRSDGDGTQTRDMTYVDNVVDACILASNKSDVRFSGDCFNVACGESVSNNEILDFLKEKYPKISVETFPPRAGDVKHTLADISKIRSCLGYEPKVKFWEGLEKTIKWWEDNSI